MPKKPDKSIQELTRALIKLLRKDLKLDDINWEEPENIYRGMDENAKREFNNQIHTIKSTPAFKKLIDFLANKQIIYTALEADNYEKVNFGRASVNGIFLVEEYVDQFEKIWQGENEKKETFDKHNVI